MACSELSTTANETAVGVASNCSSDHAATSPSSTDVSLSTSIESTVLVDDGGIVVIGGLISDSDSLGDDKVPLLGDIPVLGNLFSYKTHTRSKTNLMVFLRPRIIRDAASYQALTSDRYDYVMGKQKQGGDTTMIWREPPPSLPPRQTEQTQEPASPAAKQ